MKNAPDPSNLAIFAVIVASLFLLSASTPSANICVEERLKPLRQVSGIVVDPYDRPIPNTKVEILKGGMGVSAVRTGEDGKFSFGHLNAGSYEVRAEAPGFHAASFHISLVKPQASAKRVLRIQLDVVDGCSSIRSIKPETPF